MHVPVRSDVPFEMISRGEHCYVSGPGSKNQQPQSPPPFYPTLHHQEINAGLCNPPLLVSAARLLSLPSVDHFQAIQKDRRIRER